MFPFLKPTIPNLEIGFSYLFGKNLRQSHWSIDYLLPFNISSSSRLFAEFHGNFTSYKSTTWVPILQNFWNLGRPGFNTREDLSIGLGYRKLINPDILVGANIFYDTTRLTGNQHSSMGFGLETTALGPADSAFDLNFNYYGKVFSSYDSRGSAFPTSNIVDGYKEGNGNFDLQAGFSMPVFNNMDMRLKLTGYQFEVGSSYKRGWKGGSEFTTADGIFRFSAEYGHDDLYRNYGVVGGFVNIGFDLTNLVRGNNPFSSPEPVFKSPRNLNKLMAQPVRRNWFKPNQVVVNSKCTGLPEDSLFYVSPDTACFYSGYPDALNACKAAGHQVLAYTPGWAYVNSYVGNYPVPPYDDAKDITPMWDCASAAYAREASGIIYVYLTPRKKCDKSSVFHRVELPTLWANPKVSSILVFVGTGSDPSAYVPDGDWINGSTCP
jgi:hypothetical protein